MSAVMRNIAALIRGNLICGWNALQGKCKYTPMTRVFRHARIELNGGYLRLGENVAIGERTQLTLRKNAEVKLGDGVSLNSDCKLVCHQAISIDNNTILGPNVLIYDHDHLYSLETGVKRKEYMASEIMIGKNCWIGAGAIILRGTHIGDNCLVGAGSVVKGDFPNGTKIIQKREVIGRK